MSKSEVCELGDLIEFQRGYDLPKSDFVVGPYPVQSSNGVLGYHNEFKVKGPGITIGRSGIVGIPHFIEGNFFPHNTTLFIKDFKGNDVKYIYYLLKNIRLGDRKSGSVVPTMNRNHLHPLKVMIFRDVDYQNKLSCVLSSIDKKIELNSKINSELENMVKLIYDYWFMQFDFPDENGKPYKSSGGKMVYNEDLKREIPYGWGAGKLRDFESKIITGKTPPTADKENFGGDIPFICIDDVRGNMYVTKTHITLSKVGAASQESKFIPKGAICVTCIASPGLVALASSESQTNQQLNSVVCKSDGNRYFLYFYLRDYFNFAKAKTGNTFANMSKDDFSSILLPYPKKEIVDKFSETVKSSFDKVLLHSQESNHLMKLREWLLPMLMNGQVKIKSNNLTLKS